MQTSNVVAAGGKLTVTTHRGSELRAYWMANGSLPPAHEVGALSVTVLGGSGPSC